MKIGDHDYESAVDIVHTTLIGIYPDQPSDEDRAKRIIKDLVESGWLKEPHYCEHKSADTNSYDCDNPTQMGEYECGRH